MRPLSGNLGVPIPLEPSGPVQACNGIAFLRLPFYSFGRSEELAEGRGWEFAQRVRFLM